MQCSVQDPIQCEITGVREKETENLSTRGLTVGDRESCPVSRVFKSVRWLSLSGTATFQRPKVHEVGRITRRAMRPTNVTRQETRKELNKRTQLSTGALCTTFEQFALSRVYGP